MSENKEPDMGKEDAVCENSSCRFHFIMFLYLKYSTLLYCRYKNGARNG